LRNATADTNTFQFSIRRFFAIAIVVAIVVVGTLEYGGMARVDGGGKQTVTVQFSDPRSVSVLRYAPVREAENIKFARNALASNDLSDIYQLAPLNNIGVIKQFKEQMGLVVDQQWSHTSMGLTQPRHYVQTFSSLIVYVEHNDGSSTHHVVVLPKYNRPTEIDLSKN